MVTRVPNWEDALVNAEERLATRSWDYGSHDCAQAVFEVVRALTGEDLTKTFRYETESQVNRLLSKGSILVLAKRIASNLGWSVTDRKMLHRGDPLLVKVNGVVALGFVGSNGKPMVANATGLLEINAKNVVVGWVIPCRKSSPLSV